MKNRSKCLFMCLLLLFVMNGSGVYAAAIKTNVPDERLEAGIYTSQDGEYTVKIPYLRQPDARIEERQITPQSDAIVFADYAGSVFSVVRMDNSETQSTVDEIAAIYKVAGLLIQKEIIATHRGQELRLLYVEEGGSPLITRTRVSGRWVESGMDLYQAGTIFIVNDVIYEAFAGVTPYVPPHLMKTAQSRDELFARAELNLLKFINGLSIKSQEIVDELNVEKELIAKKESELHAKLAPQAKDTGVKPAFNLWYLAGDISLPMYFKKVWYRPAKLGFSLKAYSKSGSLRVSEDAIDFDSRKKKIHIPVSAIESIRYGRIGMDAANFWVTIKYTTSNEESIASFKDGSKLGHGPDTELIYATVWQVANPSLDGPRELEPDQESELDDGLKALVNGDYTRALQILRPLAEQDNVDAQVIIGMMYSNGSGVELSISESIKWYQKAAESGDTEAQTKLGMMYVNGEGVAVDYAEAVKWFSMAAAAGDSQGLYHLGVAYYTGQGIEKNESKAAELFRQSAEQGHTWAQSNLARCYITGVGVVADNVHAYKWSLVARDQGDEPALEYIDYLMTVMTTEEKRLGRELAEAFEPAPSPADQKLIQRSRTMALLKEGPSTSWHENGQKKAEGNWVNGKQDGPWTEWYDNGQKKFEGNYVNGEREGLVTWWHANGQKEFEENYVNGKLEGPAPSWHANGQRHEEGNYVNGQPDGPWTKWHENGQKEAEANWVNGKPDGPWTKWHENGQKKAEGNYVNGKNEGPVTWWHANGQKEFEGNFVNGKEKRGSKWWDENGNKKKPEKEW